MMNKRLSLKIKPEDQIRLERILDEMGDIIHRSSDDPSLALDFEFWVKTVFGDNSLLTQNSKYDILLS